MVLSSGAKLGSYEIVAPIGAGGMGEVYRARDERLRRDVAVKILPSGFSEDPDRLRRFEQEAHATAALNHPNILAVYDVGAENGIAFLVSELLDGESLRAVLARGALPVRRAIDYATQIAHGLAAAHEKGVVHRDLKPENLFVTRDGRVKILDFGLAKLAHTASASSSSATTVALETTAGTLLGTIGYMSPEQARGLTVDHRTDIFAFGAILYEMLSGRRAFEGATPADTLSAILTKEPVELEQSAAPVPPMIEAIVRRCLDKDPARRFSSAGDLAFAISAIGASTPGARLPAAARPVSRERLAWAAICLLSLAALAVSVVRQPPATPSSSTPVAFRFPALTSGADFAVSPGGTYIAFRSIGEKGEPELRVRPLGSHQSRLAGQSSQTGSSGSLFWYPDEASIGFVAAGQVRRVSLDGAVQTLCDGCDADPNGGAAVNGTGEVLFVSRGRIQLLRPGGVSSSVFDNPPPEERSHSVIQFLDDGRRFLFGASADDPDKSAVFMASLDEPARRVRLLSGSAMATFSSGFLLYRRGTQVVGRTFDPDDPERLAEARTISAEGAVQRTRISVSATGVLGMAGVAREQQRNIFRWFDRTGAALSALQDAEGFTDLAVSPDGQRVAVHAHRADSLNLWLHDLARGTTSRFTFSDNHDRLPAWTPDGRAVVYSSESGGVSDLHVKALDGASTERRLLTSKTDKFVNGVSPDGRLVMYATRGERTDWDLWIVPFDGGPPRPYVQDPFAQRYARFSPDGRWVAYSSDESGRAEIYVDRFPERGAKSRVSTTGGELTLWRADGRELYFVAERSRIVAVSIENREGQLHAGMPRELFAVQMASGNLSPFAASPDGSRFLVDTPRGDVLGELHVIVNWPSLLAAPRQ